MTYKITSALTLMMCAVCLLLATSSFAGTATYIYDELNRLKEVQLGNGNSISYEYDELGNLLSKTPHGNIATITATTTGSGKVLPAGTTSMFKGNNRTYTIKPDDDYRVADVKIDGVSLADPNITSYTFPTVTANHTIEATFMPATTTPPPLPTYAITSAITFPGFGGTISPASATVAHGGSQTFTITPDAGFVITDVKADGVSKGAVTSYSFTNVAAGHTISASFATTCAATAVKNRRTGTTYATLQAAYNDAALQNGDTILVTGNRLVENFTASGKDISITIDGGYKCDFSSNPYATIITGAPRIISGTVMMNNVNITE